MIIIREIFIAKPGHAGEFAKLMKDSMSSMPNIKTRVMLDYVTDYNKIVIESEMESLADFEKMMEDYKKDSDKVRDKMKGYTELYQTGKREIYRIVE